MSQHTPAEQLRINEAIMEAQARLETFVTRGHRNLTRAEKFEADILKQRISCLKAGYGLDHVNAGERSMMLERTNEAADQAGLDRTNINFTVKTDREKRAADFRKFVLESRDGGVGSNTPGSYAGLGYFVPTGFISDVTKLAQKAGDAILNPDYVTYLRSKTGNPVALPVANDTENDASAIGEGAQGTVPDVAFPGQIKLGAISYRQTYIASIEALNDVEASGNLLNVWEQWTAARIARGVGRDMLTGSQTAPIVGLVDQLSNAGVVPTIAIGSSEITGGAETGATSIGNTDLAQLVWNLDSLYRSSPKCAFWMSDLTLLKLAQLVNKFGNPIVQWQGSAATIWGYPVRICPSLSVPAASQVPVLFGDGSFIYVREVQDKLSGVQVLRERYIDAGQVGLRTITRWDCKLAYQGQGQAPFTVLQNHS